MTALLQLSDCWLSLGGREVLGRIALEVHAGEVVALVGSNGAGKTSLLKVMAGELPPSSGGRHLAAGVSASLLADTPFLYDVLTAAEHLELVGRLSRRAGGPDPRDLLDDFDLGAVARTYARDLSLGERRRLALALCETGRPGVVLMDEPFNGTDVLTGELLRSHVSRMSSEGRGVVVVTHHVRDLDGLAGRVVVLDAGRVRLDRAVRPGETLADAVAVATQVRP